MRFHDLKSWSVPGLPWSNQKSFGFESGLIKFPTLMFDHEPIIRARQSKSESIGNYFIGIVCGLRFTINQ
jgi:hypothetical protein